MGFPGAEDDHPYMTLSLYDPQSKTQNTHVVMKDNKAANPNFPRRTLL